MKKWQVCNGNVRWQGGSLCFAEQFFRHSKKLLSGTADVYLAAVVNIYTTRHTYLSHPPTPPPHTHTHTHARDDDVHFYIFFDDVHLYIYIYIYIYFEVGRSYKLFYHFLATDCSYTHCQSTTATPRKRHRTKNVPVRRFKFFALWLTGNGLNSSKKKYIYI